MQSSGSLPPTKPRHGSCLGSSRQELWQRMGHRARPSATREQKKRKRHTTRTTSIDHTQWTNPARRRHAHPHPKTQRGPRLSWERVDNLARMVRQKGDDIPDGEKHSKSYGDDHFDPAMTWQGLAALQHADNKRRDGSVLNLGAPRLKAAKLQIRAARRSLRSTYKKQRVSSRTRDPRHRA